VNASSTPLQITAKLLAPAMIILSLIILYRGHHLPGGGFIGGLVAASGVGLVLLGRGVEKARAFLFFPPVTWIVSGLAIASFSGLIAPMIEEGAFLEGVWLPSFVVPLLGVVHLGSPLLFDVGVYLVVVGFTLMCLFALVETENEPAEEE
jgi:multisubunit Na+/H+ antiporter MnhB subunit